MFYQWRIVLGYWQTFLDAGLLTLRITCAAFVLSLVLALIAALGRNSHSLVVRAPATFYVETIRNTPVLVQIFIFFFGLPSVGIRLDALTAGALALGVNVGAYLAESLRAGINSVPPGQTEAASILGLGRTTILWRIVLPQAFRTVYPTIVNNFIVVLLGTSLLSAIGVPELTGEGLVINSRTLLFVQVFVLLFVIYLALSSAFTWLGEWLGRRIFKPPLAVRMGHRRSIDVVARQLIGVGRR